MADASAFRPRPRPTGVHAACSSRPTTRTPRARLHLGDEAAKARFEDRELLRRFQEVQELPDRDKEIVKELLDAFLTKRQIQQIAAR